MFNAAACSDGQLRLVSGVHLDGERGVLQVCFNQRWGIVDNYVDAVPVACQQLGYTSRGIYMYMYTYTV